MLRHALARGSGAALGLQPRRPALALAGFQTLARSSAAPTVRALRPAGRLHATTTTTTAAGPALARLRLAARRFSAGPAADAAKPAAEAAAEPWYRSAKGLMVLGNVTYLLQLGGFLMTEQLLMRSFLVGGSGVFVIYALLQPTRLWVPAMWEATFASIHARAAGAAFWGSRAAGGGPAHDTAAARVGT